jgi:glycosyltransferase involved in cell wall biosynthesis
LIDNNGLIAENNPKELAFAIKRLLKENELRKKMSINAVNKAKNFDWDVIAKELASYYKSILKN